MWVGGCDPSLTRAIPERLCGKFLNVRRYTNFNGFLVLPSLLQRRRLPEGNQTLHNVWPSPGLVQYTYILFRGLLPPDRIFHDAKFTVRPSLEFASLAALLRGTAAAGVSQTLRRRTRNGITELSQRATITLSIGPSIHPFAKTSQSFGA